MPLEGHPRIFMHSCAPTKDEYLVTQTMIAPAYESACGGSASVHNYGVMHPDPVLLSDMTSAERGAVYRYLARFAELDDAKIFYAYGHADELAAKEAARTGSFATV